MPNEADGPSFSPPKKLRRTEVVDPEEPWRSVRDDVPEGYAGPNLIKLLQKWVPASQLMTELALMRQLGGARSSPLFRLPEEVIVGVLSQLQACDLVKAGASCRTLYRLTSADVLWRPMYEARFPVGAFYHGVSFKEHYRRAMVSVRITAAHHCLVNNYFSQLTLDGRQADLPRSMAAFSRGCHTIEHKMVIVLHHRLAILLENENCREAKTLFEADEPVENIIQPVYSDGRVYVCTTPKYEHRDKTSSRLMVFDTDGKCLHDVYLTDSDNRALSVSSFIVTEKGEMYVALRPWLADLENAELNGKRRLLFHVFDKRGQYVRPVHTEFPRAGHFLEPEIAYQRGTIMLVSRNAWVGRDATNEIFLFNLEGQLISSIKHHTKGTMLVAFLFSGEICVANKAHPGGDASPLFEVTIYSRPLQMRARMWTAIHAPDLCYPAILGTTDGRIALADDGSLYFVWD